MRRQAIFSVVVSIWLVSICPLVSFASEIDASLLNSIKYAREQANTIGADIWPDYEMAPFGFLVTLENREVLFCHHSSVEGFKVLPTDGVTKCDTQERGSVFAKNFLAAMPVFDGISTIVMGTPESTGRTSADWTRTIFHEHFHQYQSEFNHYYSRLNDLELSNGDTSGMWMLNYPFPYENRLFVESLYDASHALHDALMSMPSSIQQQVAVYLKARKTLEFSVSKEDWKYLELQLWAEGVARWTEIKISEQTSDNEIVESGKSLRARSIASLLTLDPEQSGRVIVYPYGAAEAMLLERCKSNWRSVYPDVMSLGSLIDAINLSDCQ